MPDTHAATPHRRTPRGLDEIVYRLRWLAGGTHAGSHRSRLVGPGDVFHGTAPLAAGRDARRLDLRASATDPYGRPWVREFRQRGRVPVLLLADVSRSMQFVGGTDRLGLAAHFAQALGRGAFRRGDPFGMLAADGRLRTELILPPIVSRQAGPQAAERLLAIRTAGVRNPPGADGLLQAARWLPRQRSLLFVLTDGHLEPGFLDRLLRRLVPHEVVVVLLRDSAERLPPVRWGLVRLEDLESGRERLVFLRPGLAERMAEREAARLATLGRIATRRGASMLQVEDRLDLLEVTRHFLAIGGTA